MSRKLNIREAAKKLNPIDDLMFRKMAEDKNFCEEILRVILSDPCLTVLSCTPQYDVTNLQGRSVILDARCVLSSGKQVNVEVQKSDDDDHQKRMRYHGAVLTANLMNPGEKFEHVPDVCAVFISRFDLFEAGHAAYHIDRIVRETGEQADNGFEEIYVNAAVKDGSDIAKLMEVFTQDHAYSEQFPVTSAIKRRLKETEEGEKIMSGLIEKIRLEGQEEGIENVNMLNAKLLKEGRITDLERSATDRVYQTRLMKEYFPEFFCEKH